MAKRTIRNAFWRHKTTDGGYRISYFGDEVDLPADEVKRGDAAGVFDPAPPVAVTAAQLEATLANAESRIRQPDGAAESDAAPLHHDILTERDELVGQGVILRSDGEDLPEDAEPIAPALVTEPIGPDPAATLELTPQAESDRPKKSATVDVWEDYVVRKTAGTDDPITPEQAKSMNKTELMAAVPASDG